MNLQEARIVLRPRAPAEVWDLALLWCVRVGGRTILRFMVRRLWPVAVVLYLLHAVLELHPAWVWLLAVTIAPVLQGPFTILAGTQMFAPDASPNETLARFRGHLGAFIGALLLLGLAALFGSLLVVGLPIVMVAYAFVPEAVLLEQMKPLAALARAHRIAGAMVGRLIGFTALRLLFTLYFVFAAESLGQFLFVFTLQFGSVCGSLIEDKVSLFALLGFFASIPLTATARFLEYVDARTRLDGWDLQVRFMALMTPTERGRPS